MMWKFEADSAALAAASVNPASACACPSRTSVRISAGDRPRLVIVGGGFAGLHLAKRLRKADLQVVLLDRNNFHTFQPLLYQVATAMLEPDAVANSFRNIFQGQENLQFRMVEVNRIDPANKTVHTSAGCLGYDFLVIATGARTNFFGLNEVAAHAFAMKDVGQALAIRQRVFGNLEKAMLTNDAAERRRLLHIVIVGGGPTGIEIAGALGELKKFILPLDYPELDLDTMRIYLLEAADRLLAGMSAKASRLARQALERLGVTVQCNTLLAGYDGTTARTADKQEIPTELLIWVAGVTGNIPPGLVEPDGIAGGRIRVDAKLRVPGRAGVYALGDVAAVITEQTPQGHPMLAPVAIQQAENLAANLIAATADPGADLSPFRYRSHGIMATIGRNSAVVEGDGRCFGGFPAWLTWLFVHLLALVGFRNKLIAFVNWSWNYVSYERGVRIILPPPRAGKDADAP